MESLAREREVQVLWLVGAFRRRGLLTEDGRPVEIHFPGFPAVEGGPDFRSARLRIDGEERAGDVEVHLTPAGWRRHGHGDDASYAGVILHVALRRDPFAGAARGLAGAVPELILEPYLEIPSSELAGRLVRIAPMRPGAEDLARLGEERLAARSRRLERLAAALGRDGALCRELMIGLGYSRNKPGFAELARLVPWDRARGVGVPELRRRYEEVAARITWRRPGRPANHPRRRLDGWIRFVASLGGGGLLEAFLVDLDGAEARLDPDGVGLLGPERAHDLVVSSVLPAAVAFGDAAAREEAWRRLRSADAAPPNRRLREAAAALGRPVPGGVVERLGLLEWRSRR